MDPSVKKLGNFIQKLFKNHYRNELMCRKMTKTGETEVKGKISNNHLFFYFVFFFSFFLRNIRLRFKMCWPKGQAHYSNSRPIVFYSNIGVSITFSELIWKNATDTASFYS